MDFPSSKEREIVIDIDGFVSTGEEVGTPSPADENSGNAASVTVSVDENSSNPKSADEISKKNNSKREKGKPMSKKKPSKPPRPPRGLSLDAFDQKLIKEISELAMLKRAKIERMKALKKMKGSPSSTSSSSGNLMAILFTFIFCLVIILQGCHSSGMNKPALLTRGSLESSTVPLTSIGSPNMIMQPVLLGPEIAGVGGEKSIHGGKV